MTFHFPIKLNKGNSSALLTALSVSHLPTAGINCDCAYILTEQVASQMPGLYLHDGIAWRFALDKTQLDSCVIFGREIELYYQLAQNVEITAPALIFRNTLRVQGTILEDGSSAVFAVVLLPTGAGPGAWAPILSPNFEGIPTAPTAAPSTNTIQLATTEFVQLALAGLPPSGVASFNNRTGAISLVLSDVTSAGGAPLNSPAFTGVPTAPTPLVGDTTGKIATTAFVAAALAGLPQAVASFNTRTGAVVLTLADITEVGGAPTASPVFSGTPTAPTPLVGDVSTKLATTAFVSAALGNFTPGVASFNTRTGAVTLTLADVTSVGGAPLNSPAFTGVPTAPTPDAEDNSTKLATTAFVAAAVSGSVSGVASFNTRTGDVVLTLADITTVGGAPTLSPTFTGNPTAPTPGAADNSTNLATTAFVTRAMSGVTAGVSSFNTRTGEITLTLLDVTGVGGAPLASPTFTGVPTAPTPATDDDSTKLATTEFVQAGRSLAALNDVKLVNPIDGESLIYQGGEWINVTVGASGVASFNSRTGAIVLTSQDVIDALGFTPTEDGLIDAPSDGKLYGRMDSTWSEVSAPTIVGPLQSVVGADTVSVIQENGEGTGIAILRALKSSPTVSVNVAGGVISLESASSVSSVAGVSPVSGNVPLTATDVDALPITGGLMDGPINMNGEAMTGLPDPVTGSEPVTLNSLSLMTLDAGEY